MLYCTHFYIQVGYSILWCILNDMIIYLSRSNNTIIFVKFIINHLHFKWNLISNVWSLFFFSSSKTNLKLNLNQASCKLLFWHDWAPFKKNDLRNVVTTWYSDWHLSHFQMICQYASILNMKNPFKVYMIFHSIVHNDNLIIGICKTNFSSSNLPPLMWTYKKKIKKKLAYVWFEKCQYVTFVSC